MIARNPTSPIPGVHSLAQNLDFSSEGFILSQAIAQSAAFWLGAFILLRCLLTSIIHTYTASLLEDRYTKNFDSVFPVGQAGMHGRQVTDRQVDIIFTVLYRMSQ